MVSVSDSPFDTEDCAPSATLSTAPPSRCIADSKERRVRVLGSKKRVASWQPRPRCVWPRSWAPKRSAQRKSSSMSGRVRSAMPTMCLPFSPMLTPV